MLVIPFTLVVQMLKLNREGMVYINGILAGKLSEMTDQSVEEYIFKYDDKYLETGTPIGHHFPLTATPYVFDVLPPFFSNLTSEGWLRAHQSHKARLDKEDSFGLLLANGKELIGAVSVIPSKDIVSK